MNTTQQTILFIAATPASERFLKSQTEQQTIKDVIDVQNQNGFYRFDANTGVTADKFVAHLRRTKPFILHFSGHGFGERQSICLHDAKNSDEVFTPHSDAFAPIIQAHSRTLKCLFVNACNSAELIEKCSPYVDYSIGFQGAILDDDAIAFAKHFYQNLFTWATIPYAYLDAKRSMRFQQNNKLEVKPIFKTNRNFDMEQYISYLKERENLADIGAKTLQSMAHIDTYTEGVANQYEKEFLDVLENNPFARFALWFSDKKTILCKEITKKLLPFEKESRREDFAEEFDILLVLLEAVLINFEHNELTEKDVWRKLFSFEVTKYCTALDYLPLSVPQEEFHDDTIPFLKDHIVTFKKLLIKGSQMADY